MKQATTTTPSVNYHGFAIDNAGQLRAADAELDILIARLQDATSAYRAVTGDAGASVWPQAIGPFTFTLPDGASVPDHPTYGTGRERIQGPALVIGYRYLDGGTYRTVQHPGELEAA